MESLILLCALVAPLPPPEDPPLADRERFPPRAVAAQAMACNRAYRRFVQARQALELHRWFYWQEVLAETDYLFNCWDWLHAAQGGEGRDEAYWRHSLKRLRELLGEDAYYAGRMPSCVPFWRFQPLD